MKKLLQLILMTAVIVCVFVGKTTTVNATEIVRESGTWGTLNWKVTSEAVIISGTGEMLENEKGSYPWDIKYTEDNVTKIIIEEGVTSIAFEAFYCKYDIQSVSISSTVKEIGTGAFGFCKDLTTVTFAPGSQLETLGDNAFYGVPITQIVLPDSVTTIGTSCFGTCTNLKSVYIGNKVSVIGGSAFSGCSQLMSINLPDTLQTIEGGVFSGCTGLKAITIPSGVKEIGNGAFSGCTGLTTITIPSRVKEIGNGAFSGCSGLDGNITIPKSVETIGQNVFASCTGIDSVNIYAATTLPHNIFGNCTELKGVVLGSEVKKLTGTPFKGCLIDSLFCYNSDTVFDVGTYYFDQNNLEESVSDNFVVYGYFNSTAEAFADKWRYDFIAIAPTLSKVSNASTGVKVEWNASPGATNYRVYRSITKDSGYSLIKSGVTSTSYIDTSAISTKTYYYKIVACKDDKTSSFSTASDSITYLAAPTFKKVVNVVSGVHVYWNASARAKTYDVYRSTTKASGYSVIKSGLTATHYIDTTAKSGTTYYYKIVAVNGSLKSGYSAPFNAITYVGTPDITSRANSAYGVRLGWDKISGATGYAIYRKPYEGTTWVRVATIAGNNTFTWMDESVKANNGTVYKYTIRALAGSDMKTLSGCRSTGRTMARLTSRTLNSATKASATSIKCNWSTTSVCNGYEVRFMVGDTVYKTFTVGNYKTGVKTFTGLKTGQTYKIQVRSYKKVDGVGTFYSAWSTEKYVKL